MIQKKIKLDNKRVISYAKEEDESSIQIRDNTYNSGTLDSGYYFVKDNNYQIGGYTVDNDVTSLSFEVDNLHPFYLPFMNLLSNDDLLIIEDDNTKLNNRKYLKIIKVEDKVILQFVNNFTDNKSKLSYNKFNLFIRDIYYNIHSKINQKGLDTKERLGYFFSEISYIMMNDEIKQNEDKPKTFVKKWN